MDFETVNTMKIVGNEIVPVKTPKEKEPEQPSYKNANIQVGQLLSLWSPFKLCQSRKAKRAVDMLNKDLDISR